MKPGANVVTLLLGPGLPPLYSLYLEYLENLKGAMTALDGGLYIEMKAVYESPFPRCSDVHYRQGDC